MGRTDGDQKCPSIFYTFKYVNKFDVLFQTSAENQLVVQSRSHSFLFGVQRKPLHQRAPKARVFRVWKFDSEDYSVLFYSQKNQYY